MAKRKDDEVRSDKSSDGESAGGEACESETPRAQDESDAPRVGAVREKIGEGPRNLRQRGEWYRRRTGSSDG